MKKGRGNSQTESIQEKFEKCQAEAAKENKGVLVNVHPDTHKPTFEIRPKEELYWREVNIMFNDLKKGFEKKWDKIKKAKEKGYATEEQEYIDKEIEYHKYLFGKIKKNDLEHDILPFPHHFLPTIRELYQKLIVDHHKDYNIKVGSYIKFQTFNAPPPNDVIGMIVNEIGTDPYHIVVEARSQYYNWLSKLPKVELKNDPQLLKSNAQVKRPKELSSPSRNFISALRFYFFSLSSLARSSIDSLSKFLGWSSKKKDLIEEPPEASAEPLITRQKEEPKKDDPETPPSNLHDFFESIPKYNYIMTLLVEKGHCYPNTYNWVTEMPGDMSYLAGLLKNLHLKKYYKNNKRPTNKEFQEIAQNTFGMTIGFDTVKKAKVENTLYEFIPVASTID